MGERPPTKSITVHVSDASYDMARELAAMAAGSRLTDFAAEVLERGLEVYAQESCADSPETRLFLKYRVVKKAERQRKMLEYLAEQHQKNPTEQNREELEKICLDLGLSLDDIVDDIASQSSSVPLSEDMDEKTEEVCSWIRSILKPKDRLLSENCKASAEEKGFSRRTVTAAMQRLGVVSKKMSSGKYFWMYQEHITKNA